MEDFEVWRSDYPQYIHMFVFLASKKEVKTMTKDMIDSHTSKILNVFFFKS